MAGNSVQAAIAQARSLEVEARVHKKNAEFHRREAARKRHELELWIKEWEARGVTIVMEQVSSPMPQGGTSGDYATQDVGAAEIRSEEARNSPGGSPDEAEAGSGPAGGSDSRHRPRKRRKAGRRGEWRGVAAAGSDGSGLAA